MARIRSTASSLHRAAVTLLTLASLAGCAGKAQTLMLATSQFEAESLAAIDRVQRAIEAEVAPPARSDAEAQQEFVGLIMGFTGAIDEGAIELALDPDAIDLTAAVDKRRADMIQRLRVQYASFARVFDRLDQGSFFARNDVGKAAPFAEKLTAQMVGFAESFAARPIQFTQSRNQLVLDLQLLRGGDAATPTTDEKRRRRLALYGLAANGGVSDAELARSIAVWRDRWLQLLRDENNLTRETVAQCLKAAMLGSEVRTQIVNYNQLSIKDISEAMSLAVGVAGTVTGEDLSDLEARIGEVKSAIESDPGWSALATTFLDELNKARVVPSGVEPASQGVDS